MDLHGEWECRESEFLSTQEEQKSAFGMAAIIMMSVLGKKESIDKGVT